MKTDLASDVAQHSARAAGVPPRTDTSPSVPFPASDKGSSAFAALLATVHTSQGGSPAIGRRGAAILILRVKASRCRASLPASRPRKATGEVIEVMGVAK